MMQLNGIPLKNRVLVSGGLEYGLRKPWLYKPYKYGAVITRPITFEPREYPHKDLNDFRVIDGYKTHCPWANVGAEHFSYYIFPQLEKRNINTIVSVRGIDNHEYFTIVDWVHQLDIAAIEIDISYPGLDVSISNSYNQFLGTIREMTDKPLILKIGFHQSYAAIIANGKDFNAIHALEAIEGADIGPDGGYVIADGICEVSGKFMKPIAIKFIHDLRRIITIPIIGAGGISNLNDVKSFIYAGSDAISIKEIKWNQFGLRRKLIHYTNGRLGNE